MRLRRHRKRATKLTVSRSMPSGTPIPIPIFVAPLDDVEDNADVDNADVDNADVVDV